MGLSGLGQGRRRITRSRVTLPPGGPPARGLLSAGLWRGVGSVLALGAVWAALSLILADPLRAPAPWVVLPEMWTLLVQGDLRADLAVTLRRVVLTFGVSMVGGLLIGLALGRWSRADRWFGPWLTLALNIPALVTIVLCYLWIGLNEWAAVMAVALNKIPLVAVMLREGVRVLDPDLMAMARLHGMSRTERLRHIILPQLAPHLLAAARAGIALIWKIVLVVEFLGRPNGIGFKIHLDFQMFDIAGVLANALTFALIMLAVELGIFAPLSARVSRWRGP